MQGPLRWISWIFSIFGTLMLAGTVWLWSSSQEIVSAGIRTTGEVIDLEYRDSDEGSGTYAPIVRFTDRDGNTRYYHSTSSSNPPAYERGEQVTLYYMPGAPERAMIDSFSDRYLGPIILGFMGLIFGGVGYGLLYAQIRKRRRTAHLEQHGIPIHAEFVECYRDTSTRVNGRSPWKVVAQAQHPASGKLEDFTSDMIWVDLTQELTGRRIPVRVDPQDPQSYLVDLSQWLHDEDQG